ncbi:putative holin-like toxin [Leuconostoc mesenteroides]|nr:putative holin-like toxin [Leuconostoc mesenteroides]
MNLHSRKGVAKVSVSDALELMLMFGTFIVALLALVVELIKNQQKKITPKRYLGLVEQNQLYRSHTCAQP